MKLKKAFRVLVLVFVMATVLCVPAFAAAGSGTGGTGGTTGTAGTGNVATVVEQTWLDAASQIKTVVNSVVFPALTMVLGIAFFCKLAMAFFDYRKHGQFEWAGPIILFACLVLVLTAPLYIWTIIGI